MKRQEPESIGDILRSVFEETCMAVKLREARACELWPRIVGPEIAGMCRRPVMRNGVMTVGVSSAPLRQELMMTRSSIIRILNDSIGQIVVNEIRFVS